MKLQLMFVLLFLECVLSSFFFHLSIARLQGFILNFFSFQSTLYIVLLILIFILKGEYYFVSKGDAAVHDQSLWIRWNIKKNERVCLRDYVPISQLLVD